MRKNTKVIEEIAPLSDKDCLYVVERHKKFFDYPIHTHSVCELNLIVGGAGLQRIVGDSVQTCDDLEMVLITSPLEHCWEQGECNKDVQEITIQFDRGLMHEELLKKNQFNSIRVMLERAEKGLLFSADTILRVYDSVCKLIESQDSFDQITSFMYILHRLSMDSNARVLSSGSFAGTEAKMESRRVHKIETYIEQHYFEDIRLSDLANMVGMSEVSFSRFFHLRTGKRLSEYIVDVRLGYASRMLVDTTRSISEVAYSCGFNNLSNFNRLFKKYKGYTPAEFRKLYKKCKIMI